MWAHPIPTGYWSKPTRLRDSRALGLRAGIGAGAFGLHGGATITDSGAVHPSPQTIGRAALGRDPRADPFQSDGKAVGERGCGSGGAYGPDIHDFYWTIPG
jgi:hypothetical protein